MNKYQADNRKVPFGTIAQVYSNRRRAETDWIGMASKDDGRRVDKVTFYNVPNVGKVTCWAITEKGNLLCASKGKYITLDILQAA